MWSLFKPTQSVVVDTNKGKIKGTHHPKTTKSYLFRGIPFATPPLGPLRFKKPQPHGAWQGIKDCTAFGLTAVQGFPLLFLIFLPKFMAGVIYSIMYMTGQVRRRRRRSRR